MRPCWPLALRYGGNMRFKSMWMGMILPLLFACGAAGGAVPEGAYLRSEFTGSSPPPPSQTLFQSHLLYSFLCRNFASSVILNDALAP